MDFPMDFPTPNVPSVDLDGFVAKEPFPAQGEGGLRLRRCGDQQEAWTRHHG